LKKVNIHTKFIKYPPATKIIVDLYKKWIQMQDWRSNHLLKWSQVDQQSLKYQSPITKLFITNQIITNRKSETIDHRRHNHLSPITPILITNK